MAHHPTLRPAAPGNGLAVKHGAESVLRLRPRAAEIAEQVRSVVPARTDADEPAIQLLALQLARIAAANEWLDEHGLLTAKGQPQAVLKVMSTWENSAARLLDRLGMTPSGRAQLGLDLAKAEATKLTLSRLVQLAEAEA